MPDPDDGAPAGRAAPPSDAPLAARMRPRTAEDVVGQEDLLGAGRPLRAAIDAQMRILCGLPVPAKLNVPLLIFDKTNVATAGIPANFDDGYGDQHLKGFRKLWKLSDF